MFNFIIYGFFLNSFVRYVKDITTNINIKQIRQELRKNTKQDVVKHAKDTKKHNNIFIIKGFKNSLYQYRILEKKANYLYIDFNVNKDVLERDLASEHNGNCCQDVDKKYIGNIELLNKQTKQGYYGNNMYYFLLEPESIKKADTIIIFLHGAINLGNKGNAELSFKDNNFGGNFNRLKNLMYINNMFYASINFRDFKDKGVEDLKNFLLFVKNNYPNIKNIIFIPGSSGGELLSNFLNYSINELNENGLNLRGIIGEGTILKLSNNTLNYLKKNNVFVYIIHGQKDLNIPYKKMYNLFKSFQKRGIKTKFVLIKGGFHGTPIRMIDYVDVLNLFYKKQKKHYFKDNCK